MFRRCIFLWVVFCLSAFLAYGQATGVVSVQAQGASLSGPGGSFTMPTMRYNTPGLTGAPYSAEQVNESVQTLADGTRITRTGATERMWRDSQGRTRTERQMGMISPLNPNAPKPPVMIEIRDPIAGYAYILDTQGKVAHRITLQPMPGLGGRGMAAAPAQVGATIARAPVPVQMAPPADPNRPQLASESLGSQMIEGVMAQGTRRTTTYPVGLMGNDRPIVSVTEMWTSPDLRMTVLSKTTDPRQGESTTKLINLSRVEPDPALFMPPADYSIVDETGQQVTIHYTAQ